MLFMKEMRSKVVDECTLKESAAINQILGRKVEHTDLLALLIKSYQIYLYQATRPIHSNAHTQPNVTDRQTYRLVQKISHSQ